MQLYVARYIIMLHHIKKYVVRFRKTERNTLCVAELNHIKRKKNELAEVSVIANTRTVDTSHHDHYTSTDILHRYRHHQLPSQMPGMTTTTTTTMMMMMRLLQGWLPASSETLSDYIRNTMKTNTNIRRLQ